VLVELVAASVEADLLGHSHEDRVVVALASHRLSIHHFGRLLLEKEEARKDVDVGLDDERLDRQINAGQHPSVVQNPVADVLGRWIAEDPIG